MWEAVSDTGQTCTPASWRVLGPVTATLRALVGRQVEHTRPSSHRRTAVRLQRRGGGSPRGTPQASFFHPSPQSVCLSRTGPLDTNLPNRYGLPAAGAALSHDFGQASSGKGATTAGKVAVVAGIAAAFLMGLMLRQGPREGRSQ